MNTMQNPRMQAEALKRMGRGPDTQLIHMTDSEIDALNGLSALVFKEPLRTNPQTGLPEAGLFKQLLPTVLAIGAGAFLGPSAGALFGKGAFATGLGTGLAAAGGHLVGQAATGQDINFGRALLAGAGSGLTAGLTFNPAEAAAQGATGSLSEGAVGFDATPTGINPNVQVPVGDAGFSSVPAPSIDDMFGSVADPSGALSNAGRYTFSANKIAPTDLIRSPTEAFDYLAEEPLKRVVAPVGVAALTGEFDAPLPEAPAGDDPREPFVPQKFRATRERRDLDRDGDGEVTEEDIMEVVQALPEGQSSRFYTPTQFTPLSTGGLVNLEEGGSVKQAIQSLTGGEGTTVLPILAQAVIKPEEEEEATTKGYPLGKAGTPPGMPTTGISIGGGQPPQPFQAGGGLVNLKVKKLEDGGPSGGEDAGDDDGGVAGDAESAAAGAPGPGTGTGDDSGDEFGGEFGGFGPDAGGLGAVSGVAGAAAAAAEAASEAAARDTALAVHTPKTTEEDIEEDLFDVAMALPTPIDPTPDVADMTDFGPFGRSDIADKLGGKAVNPGFSFLGYQTGIGRGPFGGYTSSDKETAQSDVDQGYETAPVGSFSVPGFLGGVAKTAASLAVPGLGLGISALQEATTPPGTGTLGAIANVADPESAFGTGPANAPAAAPAPASAPAEEESTIEMAQGGLAGIPYFEGRVMPTGDPREDGMSDNIPFVIAGQEGGQMGMQPAILSPDEYVIPADVVSMLGNGSSTAGSNQLDQFISNFRMEKYGRPKQPPEMRGGLSSLA